MNQRETGYAKQEQRTEQQFQNKFNSVTQKTKPENQNQEHNTKDEGTGPITKR